MFFYQWICIENWIWMPIYEQLPFENNSNKRWIIPYLGLIWMSLVCRGLTGIKQHWKSSHEKFSFIVMSLTSHSNCQPEWKQMEISVIQATTSCIQCQSGERVMSTNGAFDLELPLMCMCSCLSEIRQAALRCNCLPSWNSMCTMLLSNARLSQMSEGLGRPTKQSP